MARMNAEQAPELLSGFPVVLEIPVAWGDMDAMGHVNNTVFLRWFESARIEYFDRIGWEARAGGSGPGPILAKTSCVFMLPIAHPDTVWVGARCEAVYCRSPGPRIGHGPGPDLLRLGNDSP